MVILIVTTPPQLKSWEWHENDFTQRTTTNPHHHHKKLNVSYISAVTDPILTQF